MLIEFKDEDFENKIKNEDVSVIQFSAAWCGPCKALKPVMDKLSDEYKDKAIFYYADIEDGGIKGIKDNAVGELTLEEIEQEIIEKTLQKFNSNRRKTARALNISERTLYRKINEYRIDKKKNEE